MDYNTHHIWKPLKGFYPDTESRTQVHYAFAHRFLPPFIHRDPGSFFSAFFDDEHLEKPMSPDLYIHKCWQTFERRAGLVHDEAGSVEFSGKLKRIEDLKLSLHRIDGQPVAVVMMPQPEVPVSAWFIALALGHESGDGESARIRPRARVITLEATYANFSQSGIQMDSKAALCEWDRHNKHKKLSETSLPHLTAFLSALKSVLRKK